MTEMERLLFRMLEQASIPQWIAEPYFYSGEYQSDCSRLRKWMTDNAIEQKFMLYGDQMVGGKLIKSGASL